MEHTQLYSGERKPGVSYASIGPAHASIRASLLILHIQSDAEALRSYGFGLDIMLEAIKKEPGSLTIGGDSEAD